MGLKDKLSRIKPLTWKPRPEVLLCGNIPKPMHGTAPRVVLGAVWWDKTRLAAYASTSYHCIACGVFKRDAKGAKHLEGHELYDVDYLLGRMTYVETVPLCSYCHSYIHDGRLKAMLDERKITQARYVAVIQHGDRVLRAAKLKKPLHHAGPFADWRDWRLVIDGKEYPPLHKNEKAWYEFHHPPRPKSRRVKE